MDRWNEFSYYLSENIKSDIDEKSYERNVVEAFRILGWSKFHGEIVVRQSFNIGAANKITPDIIAKKEGRNQFIIEIKQPSIELIPRYIEQLTSYMRFLRLEFGIIIGKKIQMVYDGELLKNREPFVFEEIEFTRDNPKGLEFINLLTKENFNIQDVHECVLKKLKAIDDSNKVHKLIDELTSETFLVSVKNLIKYELIKKNEEQIVDQALSEVVVVITPRMPIKTPEHVQNPPIPRIKLPSRPPKTIEQHLQGTSNELRSLFFQLDEQIKLIDSRITSYTTFQEILYRNSVNFVCTAVQKQANRLRILLRALDGEIVDPKNITQLLPKTYGTGNISRQLFVSPIELSQGKYSVSDIMNLIRQSYETTK